MMDGTFGKGMLDEEAIQMLNRGNKSKKFM